MDNYLINLSRKLYEMKCKSESIQANNVELEQRITENEENIVFAMMACTELYEMLVEVATYSENGEDGIVKMTSAMVKIYVNLVKRGLKTLDEVPEKLRAEVEEELKGGE